MKMLLKPANRPRNFHSMLNIVVQQPVQQSVPLHMAMHLPHKFTDIRNTDLLQYGHHKHFILIGKLRCKAEQQPVDQLVDQLQLELVVSMHVILNCQDPMIFHLQEQFRLTRCHMKEIGTCDLCADQLIVCCDLLSQQIQADPDR